MLEPYDDVKILWAGTLHESGLGTTKKPMRTLEDMKGMKFLAYGQWQSARIEALGMVPVSMAPTELVSNLEKGVIDGSVVALFTMDDMSLGDVVNYITLIPQPAPSVAVLMNLNTWNSLPADIQKIMDEMTPGLVDINDVAQVEIEAQYKEIAATKYGVEMIQLSAEELAKIMALDQSVKDQYIADLESKGLPGKEFMAKFLELEKKYSAQEYAPK
jgi:TRAP-type C4-dicarboxylate transport system substrate-binding protein